MSRMEDIEVMTSSSHRSVTSTVGGESRNHAPTSATASIYFGIETEPFFFLSNSFPSKISAEPYQFLNAEAMFQAAKFEDYPELQSEIHKTVWPQDMLDKVARWGNYADDNWENRCINVMLKYIQNVPLQHRLLQTGNTELVYRSKTDVSNAYEIYVVQLSQVLGIYTSQGFFGCGQDGHGLNHLGRILMKLRSVFTQYMGGAPNLLFQLPNEAWASHATSSMIWSANAASDPWYPRKSGSLKEIIISPSVAKIEVDTAPFFHGFAHAEDPWTLQVLVQVPHQKGTKSGDVLRVKIFYRCPDPHSSKNRTEYVPLSSENLSLSLELDGGLSIYSFPVEVKKTLIEVYKCTMEITISPSEWDELGISDYDLQFILWP
ncbi:hypothetical protein CF319_g4243 [Tilletia indica]|nr:hypothetical protein CF319_g4243 [Tilletia indica]